MMSDNRNRVYSFYDEHEALSNVIFHRKELMHEMKNNTFNVLGLHQTILE